MNLTAVRFLFGAVGVVIAGAAWLVDSDRATLKSCNGTGVASDDGCYERNGEIHAGPLPDRTGAVAILSMLSAVCFLVAVFCSGKDRARSGGDL